MNKSRASAPPTWVVEHLSKRDMDIVKLVSQFKLVQTLQIQRLFFAGMKTEPTGARLCRRALERLVRARVLARLERRIGGVRAGSASYIYKLGAVGQQIESGYKKYRYSREPSDGFVDHTLAITEIYVRLRQSTILLKEAQTEPKCWRPYGFAYGGKEVLKPDMFARFIYKDEEFSWFIEVDRATEHHQAINNKLKIYLDYFNSGIEQTKHDVFPQVIWAVPDNKRRSWLEQLVTPFNQQIEGLFVVTLADTVLDILRDDVPP